MPKPNGGDLTWSPPLGALVLEEVQERGLRLPALEEVTFETPEGLLRDEVRMVDMISRGLSGPDAARSIDTSERRGYQLLESARERLGARTDIQSTRILTDLGLLMPLRRRSIGPLPRLSVSQFIATSLVSRGWTGDDIMDRYTTARSTVNTFLMQTRRKADKSATTEEAVRRLLHGGALAFDRALVASNGS